MSALAQRPGLQAVAPAPRPRPAASAIYEGTVRHRRLAPIRHEFSYRIGMLYLDLDELPEALECSPLWSARRAAPGRFRREDYLGDPGVPLAHAVRDEVERQAGERPAGPIRLLTTPRTFGHGFNPVSFYFCFAHDGETVRFVVADVTNTPWGERHAYVMAADGERVMREGFDKAFHVSPFMGMDHRYEWRVTTPGDTVAVHIDSATEVGKAFDATLTLHRRPLSGRNLTRLLMRFPFASLRVVVLIYVNALKLKLKGAPYFAHPERAR